jgi:ABC-type branched-subunit amino acid transport system permease subunit
LVPGGLPGREIVEVQVFFAVWLMTILHAQVRSIRKVWREQALLCALAFAGVPLLDLITGPDAVNGLNLFCVLFAGAFAFVLWRLCRSPSGRRSTRATRQIESRS